MKNISQTDWERVNRLSDDDIDFSEIPETTEDFWKDSSINVLRRYRLKSPDVKMVVRLVERLAH